MIQHYFFLLILSLAIQTHLHAAQMNVEVKEKAEKTELTAQEQAAADKMFAIVDATNKDNAAQQVQALQKLLQRYPRIVDAKNNYGETPLMLAAWYGHAEIVQLLIAAGAQIDAQDNNGWTPLMLAARNGNAEIVKLLIAADAQIDAQNNNGWTAHDIAISYNHEKITAHDIAISYNREKIYDKAVTAGLAERQRYLLAQQVAKKELEQQMIRDLADIAMGYYTQRIPEVPELPEEKQPSWWDKTKNLASKLFRGKR